MKIPLKFFQQDTNYTCGPTSLQMVFHLFDNHLSEKDISEMAKTNKDVGTKHVNMIEVARKNGFYCFVNEDASIDEIKNFIRRDLPVIVHFMDPDGDGHYGVVIGFSKGKLILHDPWRGPSRNIKEERFLEIWHDELGKHNKWLMVLSTEDLNLGKQYLPY